MATWLRSGRKQIWTPSSDINPGSFTAHLRGSRQLILKCLKPISSSSSYLLPLSDLSFFLFFLNVTSSLSPVLALDTLVIFGSPHAASTLSNHCDCSLAKSSRSLQWLPRDPLSAFLLSKIPLMTCNVCPPKCWVCWVPSLIKCLWLPNENHES